MTFKVDNCRDGGYEMRIDNDSFSGLLLRKIEPEVLEDLGNQIKEILEKDK